MEVGFVRTELQVGLTMSRIAMEAHHPEKVQRNRASARKAYDAVMRFIPKVNFTRDEATEVSSKLAQLKSELQLLGEEI